MGIDDNSRKWWILAAMGGSLGLILLDETVVGVALPTIQRELGLSEVGSHWVVNAYLLVLAGLAAACGRFADSVGVKRLYLAGASVFALASLAAGFAGSGTALIVARGIQGIGAAVIFPVSLAMVSIVFPAKQRGMALGIYGTLGTVLLCLGPLIGGLFTDFLSWRWIFWVNPPIVVAIGLVVLFAWRDAPHEPAAGRFDGAGLVSLIGGLALLVFGLMQGPDWGWSSVAVWPPLVLGIVLLAAFAIIEMRKQAPLIEVDLFGNASFTACVLVVFLAQFTKMPVIVIGALYFQTELHMSPLGAGFALLVAVIPEPFLAIPSGRVADRIGSRKPTLVGVAATAASILWIGVAADWNSYAALVPALIVWGSCQPFLFVPPQRVVMNAVPINKQGQAGGILQTAQLLGGTIGMAISSALLTATGDYDTVFLATGALSVTVLLFGLRAIEREKAFATT